MEALKGQLHDFIGTSLPLCFYFHCTLLQPLMVW